MLSQIILFAYIFTSYCNGFYIPGVAPVEFKKGQKIEVKAVKMTSIHTQLPYEYYSLPFCKPKHGEFLYKSENLGEVLRGDRIVNTPYEVYMGENIKCKLLCHKKNDPMNWGVDDSEMVANKIRHEYHIHLLVDNLPVATKVISKLTQEILYEQGYLLGFMMEEKPYINNHLKIILKYHKYNTNSYIVVGIEVETLSIDRNEYIFSDSLCHIPTNPKPQLVNDKTGTKLYFTYSVEWVQSKIPWAYRWDTYLKIKDGDIHWLSVKKSIAGIFFLSGIIAMIMLRTLRRDIANYNSRDRKDDLMEETGWKLVYGDVFRPPQRKMLFSAVIGSGIQVFFMSLVTLFIALFGMLSPALRGELTTVAIFLYVFMGCIAGYFSGRLYSTLKGKQWKQAALLTATLYPAIVFGTCFFLNFFLMGKHSSGAVPFTTMLALLCLWFCISLPLVYLGYYFGVRKQPFAQPVRTNFIPRKVPEQVWYMNTGIRKQAYSVQKLPSGVPEGNSGCKWTAGLMNKKIEKSLYEYFEVKLKVLVAGLLPFGAVFFELFFIYNSLWENQFYYLFGFLFLVFCILVVSVSQISVVMVYFQLCGEDYHWWWKSFIVSGGASVYILAYSVFYFYTQLEITEFIPILLYIGYTSLIVLTFWLLTGTIGFIAAFAFIRKIYSAVKIE